MKRALTRWAAWLGTRTGERVAMGFCVAVQLLNLSWNDPGTWSWWVPLVCALFLVGLQVRLEWARRRLLPTQDERWGWAMETDDPVAAMARFEYLDTLSGEEVAELAAYLEEGAREGRVVDVDDVPPVVARFVYAGLSPEQRERLHGD